MSIHEKQLGFNNEEIETDSRALMRRQRQIDFGKNNRSYLNYITFIPKEKRCDRCPMTPNIYRKMSRRGFDGLVRKWKIDVHEWSDAIDVVEAATRKIKEMKL